MKNNIIASIALFQSLYDGGKYDIFSVIAEFIKSTIYNNNLHVFNITQLRLCIKNDFEIEVPESVLKTVIKKRLTKEVNKDDKNQYVALPSDFVIKRFNDDLAKQTKKYEFVFNKLTDYFEKNFGKRVPKDELIANFTDFLLTNSKDKNESLFSKFIFENESDNAFIDCLNEIREGYIIIHGIKDINDSTDINTIGSWDSKLTIYLDTEHLFSFYGYNGKLFQEVFDDFLTLVKEANKRTTYIELKYFDETRKSIESYFNAAILIKEGKMKPYAETAMNTILTKCSEKSDVIAEKGKFYSFLKSNNIIYDERANYVTEMQGNLQTQENLTEIFEDSKSKGLVFTEDAISKYLRLFSIINYKRNENNKTSFERSKCILMSANSVAFFVAWHPLIKDEKDFTFSCDIDFITSKLWFKLHKGLIKGKKPISFNVVTKAKLVITSLLYKSASSKYDELKRLNYSKDDEISVYNAIREHEILPEEITSENIDEIVSFIDIQSVEDLRREKSYLIAKIKKGEQDAKELKEIKFRQKQRKKSKIRRRWKLYSCIYYIIIIAVFIFIATGIYFLFIKLLSPNDTKLNIFSIFVTICLSIIGCMKIICNKIIKTNNILKKLYLKKTLKRSQ